YHPVLGFDPSARGPVPGSPALATRADLLALAAGTEDAFRDDTASLARPGWLSLDHHSEDVREQAERLLAAIAPHIPGAVARAVVTAAYAHDSGKAHPIWQDALCALAPPGREAEISDGRPWAKSDSTEPLKFAGEVTFRHELVSLLLLDGLLSDLLAD